MKKKRGMKAKGVANSLDKSPDEVEIRYGLEWMPWGWGQCT